MYALLYNQLQFFHFTLSKIILMKFAKLRNFVLSFSTAAFHARVRGSVPGLGGLKETKMFLPHPRVKVSIVGSLRDREVACSASDRQGSNFESCVWRTVSSQSSHHPQEVLLAQFSLYVHKGGLKPDSFHLRACYYTTSMLEKQFIQHYPETTTTMIEQQKSNRADGTWGRSTGKNEKYSDPRPFPMRFEN